MATLWVCAVFPLSGAAVSFLRLWWGAAAPLALLGGAVPLFEFQDGASPQCVKARQVTGPVLDRLTKASPSTDDGEICLN